MKGSTEETVEGMESWVLVYRVFLSKKIYTTRKNVVRKECQRPIHKEREHSLTLDTDISPCLGHLSEADPAKKLPQSSSCYR